MTMTLPLASGGSTSQRRSMRKYRRTVSLLEADIEQELVALDVQRDLCFGFNGPATVVWKLLQTPRASSELVDLLTAEFDVGRSECEADVSDLLTDLRRHGLVELV